eukprot:4395186-Lingulodinium_polyedra.AAC.1
MRAANHGELLAWGAPRRSVGAHAAARFEERAVVGRRHSVGCPTHRRQRERVQRRSPPAPTAARGA